MIGITLNVIFVAVEVVFGILASSSALLADAAHNAGDVLGLGLAWGAATLARRAPSSIHTYGLRRSTVLAALANALLLVGAVAVVAWEAIGRFGSTVEPQGPTMMWVAAVGVAVNGLSAFFFYEGSKGDANLRGAFLHLIADAAVSAGVIVAGAIVWTTSWDWVDPLTSLLVSVIVLWGTWGLLRDSLHLSLDGVPKSISLDQVEAFLRALPGVEAVHDLHVWAMSTTEIALTVHLTMDCATYPPPFLARLEHDLEDRFGIGHATVQIEPLGASPCARTKPGSV